MANYTKGEWKIDHYCVNSDYLIYSNAQPGKAWDKIAIAQQGYSNADANAHLIAAAVNACQKVNPDNPMAVAESIQEMYEALNELCNIMAISCSMKYLQGRCLSLPLSKGQKALAKAEGKA